MASTASSAALFDEGYPVFTNHSIRYAVAALIAVTLCSAVWLGLDDQPRDIRLALIIFGLAILGWTVLRLPETPVALAAALAMVISGAGSETVLFEALGHELIWLLIAAFAIAAVLRQTGAAERLVLPALARAGTVKQLFYAIALVIGATAFFIPSTSGRAALLLPIYLTIAGVIDDARINRALALLFPSVILLTACASIIGAGAHLIAVDFMAYTGSVAPGFLFWIVLGAPFALVSALLVTELILRLFLDPQERGRTLAMPAPNRGAMNGAQRYTIGVMATMVVLWSTQSWHGLDLAIVGLAGALAVTVAPLSGVSMKQAVKGVEWNLILFLAATFALGHALVDTGTATFIAETAIDSLSGWIESGPAPVIVFAAVASMLAHLVVTSRTARVIVLVPAIALPLSALGVNSAALIFLVTIGSGFCQTLTVSAKPVALFGSLDRPTYDQRDLVRLSLWLMPFMAGLLIVFSLFVWPVFGLSLAP